MRRRLMLSLVALCMATVATAQPAGGFGGFQQQVALQTSQQWKDVNYADDGQPYHTCDIYLPREVKDRYPVVIHIYGSAWFNNNGKGAADLGTIVKALLDAGYAVVCPNHRSSGDAQWPAQLHDIRAVVRFVRGQADQYHFDTRFIATSGFSSGGHLASITATTSGMKTATVGTVTLDLEGSLGRYTSQPSTVNAACDWSGPVDLTAMDCDEHITMGERSPEDILLNATLSSQPDKYLSLSATQYIDAADPPIIIFHGEQDNVVPCCQGRRFFELLTAAGVTTEATFVPGGGHGMGMYSPENLQKMVAFLNRAAGAAAPSLESPEGRGTAARGALPRVNADGTVTFTCHSPTASSVMVDVQFAGRQAMTRGDDGLWTVTLGPVAPDIYPYCYIIDGVSVMDGLNPQYFPNEGFKNSLLDMPGDGTLPHDIRPVAHGRIEYVRYYSQSLGGTNSAVVYLPPSYLTDPQKRYPVFYLISGTTDTEEVYYKVGRVNYILDNLIADGQAKEMLVVMPYGNPTHLLPAPPAQGLPQTRFGGDVFSRDLIDDLMPFIERTYRTVNNADHRAIGGFSRGGNQALYNGLTHLDRFSYLCSYSSFTSTDIPGVYDHASDVNHRLHLFWLGVGTDDFLYGNARDYMQFLDDHGIHAVKEFTTDKLGHTWMNARYFLWKTLPLLFNKRAAQAAMRAAGPAPAATGSEPQFTPGVMARMFPRPIVSPEYSPAGITFRFNAPQARQVQLQCEFAAAPMPMQRDSAGVWSTTLSDYLFETFQYCFLVDGTPVADPSNMFLAPSRDFHYSIADNPLSPFNFASQGNIRHGIISYDLNRQEAWYTSPMPQGQMVIPIFIQLIPGPADIMESWFTVGSAAAIADRLLAEGKTRPCIITTSALDGMPAMPGFSVKTLRAADYPTWGLRRQALVRLLLDAGREPAPSFPGMGGGRFGGGGFGGGGFGGGPDF